MPNYTVGPMGGGSTRWKIESNGRMIEKFNKKSNALERARELRRNNGGSVTVQGANGEFQRRI